MCAFQFTGPLGAIPLNLDESSAETFEGGINVEDGLEIRVKGRQRQLSLDSVLESAESFLAGVGTDKGHVLLGMFFDGSTSGRIIGNMSTKIVGEAKEPTTVGITLGCGYVSTQEGSISIPRGVLWNLGMRGSSRATLALELLPGGRTHVAWTGHDEYGPCVLPKYWSIR